MSLDDILSACVQDPRIALCIPWPALFGGPVLSIRWYSILIIAGIVIGTAFASIHIQREDWDLLALLNALVWIIPVAFLGARLMFVMLAVLGGDMRYIVDPIQILNFRSGGSNWFGALIGGLIITVYLARRIHFDLWLAADLMALGAWAGQGVGRFANLLNLETYGPPTGSNWFGLIIPLPLRYPQYSDLTLFPPETRFHATMLYESIWLLVTFLFVYLCLLRFYDLYQHGVLTVLYLIISGIGRFVVENWRPDQVRIVSDISYARVFAVFEIAAGIGFLFCLAFKQQRTTQLRGKKSAT